MSGTPDAEVTITSALVGDLLAEQHPDLADRDTYAVDDPDRWVRAVAALAPDPEVGP